MSSFPRRKFLLSVTSLVAFSFIVGPPVKSDAACKLHHSSASIAAGTVWETTYYMVETGKPGPTVMIVGGIHGNEPAGACAAEQIRHWTISRGRLVVLPCANRPGRAANLRYLPDRPVEERDLNRNFPTPQTKTTRGVLAQAIWKLTHKVQPDWVLDLHEGYEFNVSHQPPKGKKKSVGSSLIYQRNEKNQPLIEQMLKTVNATITDENRRFVPLGGAPVIGSWVRSCLDQLKIQGMILETTFKEQPLSRRTHQHRLLVNEVLKSLKMIDGSQVDTLLDAEAAAVSVGIFDGPGASSGGVNRFIELIGREADMQSTVIGPGDVRPEVLKQFDVLLFPGGSGSRQGRALGDPGRATVRDFIAKGKGCVGVCAGAFLCSAYYSWSLKVIDTAVFTGAREIEGVGRKQMWYRGKSADVQIELTADGKKLFAGLPPTNTVRYHNGPIVSPMNDPLLPDYTVRAYFRNEVGLYPPQKGTMVNTPAIVTAPFGHGRVVSISPHPESTEGLKSMIGTSIRWANGKATADKTNVKQPSPGRQGGQRRSPAFHESPTGKTALVRRNRTARQLLPR
ncbi:MAG: succinylglutamate desuccinylase/aspartoacylase family protein [Pirellulales bacterium]